MAEQNLAADRPPPPRKCIVKVADELDAAVCYCPQMQIKNAQTQLSNISSIGDTACHTDTYRGLTSLAS